VTNSNRTSTTYVSIQGFNTRTPVSGPFFSVKIPITAELGTIGLVFSGTTVTGFNGTATTVNIPEGVTAIGASAFAGNTNLSTITLPSTLQIIPNESFEGTPNLQSIEVGDGNNHFMSQSGILYRVWDDGGISFFHVPNRISGDIAIPNGVHTIPFYAFENRCLIRSVHISQNVSAISHNAFVGTRNLESITVQQNNRYFFVENGVLYRRNGWFVHLPEMFVRTAFLNAPMEVYNHFLNANHFRFIAPQTGYFRIDVLHRQWYSNFNVNDFTVFLQAGQTHYFYLRYNGNNINSRNSSQLIIREFLGNYTLHIEDGGGWIGGIVTGFTPLSNFDGHIIIPWNVTGIAENAFRNATNIRTITVESGGSHTITVGSYAFANSNVEEIFLPRNIGTPLRNAFLGANNLTINMARESAPNAAIWNPSNRPIRWGFVNLHGRHLYTPQGTLNSELMFFRYVGSSSEISIPRQTIGVGLPSRMVTAIYPNAFYGMARLSRVIVPDTIASIDDIYFPIWTNVHWVGRYEFRGNKFLRYLGKLPAGEIWSIAGRNITTIRDGAFLGFFGSELVIPVNIENIADNAFYGVEIEQITLPIAWSGIFGRMFGATTIQNHNDFLPLNLHTINLSYGTMLPDDSFAGLRTPPPIGHTLTVNLPSTLTSIGQRAFANNNRTWRIEIPRGVSNTTNAFETWGGLQRIYVRTNHNFILNSRTPAQVILLEEIDRPIVRPISTRIYFYARGFDWWIQPRAHAWTVETNRDLLGEWNTSSQNMTRECSNYSTNWWHIDVPVNVNEEAFYIIVYNGGHGHWGWNTTRCHYRTQHRITNFSQRYITWYYNQHGSLNWHRMHAEGYVAVFFYNRNGAWSQPRAHAWNWTKDLLGGWNTPRQNMTRECPNGTTNWWFINVPTTREFNIIIYNSSNPWYRAGQQFISPSPTSIFPRYISWRYYQEGFNSLSRGLAMH
ncbi:MAG: leucine-rich repeat domain-containing protein, partial [Firmicutes bacterium]|nr:leucine-rich repeat domain-containing protein [Bacillota bacterium]